MSNVKNCSNRFIFCNIGNHSWIIGISIIPFDKAVTGICYSFNFRWIIFVINRLSYRSNRTITRWFCCYCKLINFKSCGDFFCFCNIWNNAWIISISIIPLYKVITNIWSCRNYTWIFSVINCLSCGINWTISIRVGYYCKCVNCKTCSDWFVFSNISESTGISSIVIIPLNKMVTCGRDSGNCICITSIVNCLTCCANWTVSIWTCSYSKCINSKCCSDWFVFSNICERAWVISITIIPLNKMIAGFGYCCYFSWIFTISNSLSCRFYTTVLNSITCYCELFNSKYCSNWFVFSNICKNARIIGISVIPFFKVISYCWCCCNFRWIIPVINSLSFRNYNSISSWTGTYCKCVNRKTCCYCFTFCKIRNSAGIVCITIIPLYKVISNFWCGDNFTWITSIIKGLLFWWNRTIACRIYSYCQLVNRKTCSDCFIFSHIWNNAWILGIIVIPLNKVVTSFTCSSNFTWIISVIYYLYCWCYCSMHIRVCFYGKCVNCKGRSNCFIFPDICNDACCICISVFPFYKVITCGCCSFYFNCIVTIIYSLCFRANCTITNFICCNSKLRRWTVIIYTPAQIIGKVGSGSTCTWWIITVRCI